MIDPTRTVGEVGERALLRHLRSRIPSGPGVLVGLGDDAAVVEGSPAVLVTTDALVEGVHFRREWTPARLLGRKALTVNLSDVAAMAGTPRFATVSLCLPPDLSVAFLDGLYDGLLERAAETGVLVVGGNVSRTEGPLVVDVALLGQGGERLVLRSGAEAGDLCAVTGSLGAAAAGLRLLGQGARLSEEGELDQTGVWTDSSAPALLHCLRAQLDPSPPLALGRALLDHDVVHAGMDVSDGLSGDLQTLCAESDLAVCLEGPDIPVDSWARGLERARGGDPLSLALHGGEDYELLFALAPEKLDALRDLAVIWDLPITVIGTFRRGEPAVWLRGPGGETLVEPRSHDHFRRS